VCAAPIVDSSAATCDLSLFTLSVRNHPLMSTYSFFTVNGVPVTAQVDPSLQTSTISPAFAARFHLTDGGIALICAPVGVDTVSTPVEITIVHSPHDVVVGMDWIRSVSQHRLRFRSYFFDLRPIVSSHGFKKRGFFRQCRCSIHQWESTRCVHSCREQ
jgi:hypothetical protein